MVYNKPLLRVPADEGFGFPKLMFLNQQVVSKPRIEESGNASIECITQ